MLDQAYVKTDVGRAEIKARALPLSRSARNLLLLLDGTRSARTWLSLVQGAAEADVAYLLEQGLVGPVAAPATAVAATPQQRLAQLFGDPPQLDHQQLYAFLNGQGSKQLGLMKGYVFDLDVEKCSTLAELQQLALDLVERVQQGKGPEAAGQLRRALGIRG